MLMLRCEKILLILDSMFGMFWWMCSRCRLLVCLGRVVLGKLIVERVLLLLL